MTDDSTRDPGRYFDALNDEVAAFDDAVAAIRDELAAGRITPKQAAAEREQLLTAHLGRLAAIRARYLGGEPEPG
jgi:hypothetical protein